MTHKNLDKTIQEGYKHIQKYEKSIKDYSFNKKLLINIE